jgi:predicted naringenin-chalcone synthase
MDIAVFKLELNAVSISCECGQICFHILPCQGLSFLLRSCYCEAGKIFAKYYDVVNGTVLLFCIFVCVNLKTIEGADYIKFNCTSVTVFADVGNACCLNSPKKKKKKKKKKQFNANDCCLFG